MIRRRPDLNFLFLTKRIERFAACVPRDWSDGYENVVIGCTVENQVNADARLSLFARLPIRHKMVICQPLLGRVDLEHYLNDVELVVVGGESNPHARPLRYDWVLDLRAQCMRQQVAFTFRQCGTHFIKDGKTYRLPTEILMSQAKKADLDYRP